MTTSTATQTKTFIVRYPITYYYDVKVERDTSISEEDLLYSITRTELIAGERLDDFAWDSLKSSWREGDAEVFVIDEDDCYELADFS